MLSHLLQLYACYNFHKSTTNHQKIVICLIHFTRRNRFGAKLKLFYNAQILMF